METINIIFILLLLRSLFPLINDLICFKINYFLERKSVCVCERVRKREKGIYKNVQIAEIQLLEILIVFLRCNCICLMQYEKEKYNISNSYRIILDSKKLSFSVMK